MSQSKIETMVSRIYGRVLLALLLVPGVCVAQRYTPPPPPLTVDPCVAPPNNFPVATDRKAKPPVCPPPAPAPTTSPLPTNGPVPAAEQFPFPGTDAPAPQKGNPPASTAKPSAADQFPYPGSTAPKAPPATSKTPAADQFPYPGETSQSPDAVPEGNTPRYVPDSPAPTGTSSPAGEDGSSSSSSSSSSNDSLPTPSDDGSSAPAGNAADTSSSKKGRRALPKVTVLSPDERVTEDLRVAKFYGDRGNYEAAYLRSKDAIKMLPDDAESHFSLALAAQKLQKKDEAIAEYTLYLKLDPDGDRVAAAQKALSELR